MNTTFLKKKINNVYYLYILFSIGMLLLALTVFLANNNNLIKIATDTRQDANRLDDLDRLMKIAALFTDAHNVVTDAFLEKKLDTNYKLFVAIDLKLQYEIAQLQQNIKKINNTKINLDIESIKNSQEQMHQYTANFLNTNQTKTKYKNQFLIANFNKLATQVQNQILTISHLIRILQVQDQEARLQQLHIYSKKQNDTIVIILSVLLGILLCGLKNLFYFQHKSKQLHTTPLFKDNNEIERFYSIRFDVTEQKKLYQQLLEAQSISKIGSWKFNIKTQEQIWTSEHYKIFEIDEPQPQTQLYNLYRSRIHPDDLPNLDLILEKAIKNGEDFTYNHRVVLDQGSRVKYVQGIGQVTKDSTGQVVYISGTCRDQTDEIENDLKYQTLLETMNEGLVVYNSEGNIIKYNTSALRILEVTSAQMMGKMSLDSKWKTIHKDGTDFCREDHPANKALKTGKTISNVTMGLQLLNNQIKWIRINAVPMKNNTELYVIVTFSDITTLVHTIEENQFILESLEIGVWKYNPQNQKLNWENSMYRLYEISKSEFDGNYQAWQNLLTFSTQEQFKNEMQQALAGEKEFNTTFEILTKNGKRKFIGARGMIERNSTGDAISMYGINWDRTKEVELEINLVAERSRAFHKAKLTSLGEMSAGIAHEINNPLTIIEGSVRLLQKHQDLSDEFKTKLVTIEKSVRRISKIITGLRKFSRTSDKQNFTPQSLKVILNEIVALIDSNIKRNFVQIVVNCETESPVLCNEIEIEQVVINLINNSIDAIKNYDEKWIKISVTELESDIMLQIQDSGRGITEEVADKLFQPFFTTKIVGEGTGLGLSIVKGILDDHNAQIQLNRDHSNTCFDIKFKKHKEKLNAT